MQASPTASARDLEWIRTQPNRKGGLEVVGWRGDSSLSSTSSRNETNLENYKSQRDT